VGARKWERACGLEKSREVTVMLDSADVARGLAEAARRTGVEIEVLVELEAGLGRVGVEGSDAAVALAEQVDRLPGVRLRGLGCYPGHLRETDELDDGLPEVAALLDATVDRFDRAGLCRERVSAGSTKTAMRLHECPAVNESRAGTYVLGDLSDEPPLDFALTIQASVVSRRAGAAVIDAGAKTLSADLLLRRGGGGFGRLADDGGAELSALFDEHGVIPDPKPGTLPVGELVRVVPNHCVAVMNLFDEVVVVKDDVVVAVEPIEGRGAVA
jgi:D-serine deaminase-like pyridoxal phosphate-dependent protein